jgi:hypothetical protein
MSRSPTRRRGLPRPVRRTSHVNRFRSASRKITFRANLVLTHGNESPASATASEMPGRYDASGRAACGAGEPLPLRFGSTSEHPPMARIVFS